MTVALPAPPSRTLLLVLGGRLLPLSSAALTQAQASRREVETCYRGALLLDADGSLRTIREVRILGPFGSTPLQRLVNRITRGWRISVTLSDPLGWDVPRVREMLLAGMAAETAETCWTSPQACAARLEAAMTLGDLFAALDLPTAEEVLDVL